MDSRREIPKCNCGLDADLRTSWSNANPGRRFFGCSKYGAGRNCNFFLWCDPEIGNRERTVLVGLLKKIRKMEEGRKKERMFWIACLAMFATLSALQFHIFSTQLGGSAGRFISFLSSRFMRPPRWSSQWWGQYSIHEHVILA
ncbi:hypothetical protein GQ457_06G019870 [Hibiscus cannabinus]